MPPFCIQLGWKPMQTLYKYYFSLLFHFLHTTDHWTSTLPPLSSTWSLLLSLHSSSYPSSSSIQLHLRSLWHVGPQNWHHALVQYYTPCLPPVHAAPSWGNRDHAFVSTKKTPLSKAMSTLRIARRSPLLVGSPLLPVDFMWSRIDRACL